MHVGTGTPKKMVWPHGRGRSGIRRKYKSHLTVCPRCSSLLLGVILLCRRCGFQGTQNGGQREAALPIIFGKASCSTLTLHCVLIKQLCTYASPFKGAAVSQTVILALPAPCGLSGAAYAADATLCAYRWF